MRINDNQFITKKLSYPIPLLCLFDLRFVILENRQLMLRTVADAS